jgi:hypothetical protein
LRERHAIHILPFEIPSRQGKFKNLIDELIDSLRSGMMTATRTIVHNIRQSNLQIHQKDVVRILEAACNNGNSDLPELLSRIVDLNGTEIVQIAIEHGLAKWLETFEKYGITIPLTSLRAAIRTNKKSIINIIFQECEQLDAHIICEALGLSIELEFDEMFDHLVNCLKHSKYCPHSISSEFLVQSMKVKPYHVKRFWELDGSPIDLVSVARNCSDELSKFILDQPDVNISKVRTALTATLKMQKIDDAVAIAQAFPQVINRRDPLFLRSPESLQKQLEEIDSLFNTKRICSENMLKDRFIKAISSFPIGNLPLPSTGRPLIQTIIAQ